MTIITRIETIPCRLPPRREIITGARRKTSEERILVSILTNSGVEGWGEATAIPIWGGTRGHYFGETPQTVGHVIHDILSEKLIGADPTQINPLMDSLDLLVRGHPYAKAAIEMALQDIRGKIFGVPAYTLLGGAFRHAIPIAHMISFMEERDAIAEATVAVEHDGINAFQIKGGLNPERDVALIAAMRNALPKSVSLRLDANRAYGFEPKRVARIAARLEAAGLDALEQPGETFEVLAACRAATNIPIIADESCWQASDVVELVAAKSVDAISVYVAKSGGMSRAIETAQTAALFGLRCDLNGSLESGIGTAASIQIAMAIKNATVPSVISIPSCIERPLTKVAGHYWQDDVVDGGFSYQNGCLAIGNEPGLGIKVDRARVDRLAASSLRRTSN